MAKSKGLGDTISKITEATGIKAVVDKVSELTGIDCKCEERREALNKLYPYTRQMTEDEMKIYEEVMNRTKGTITGSDQAILVKIYNILAIYTLSKFLHFKKHLFLLIFKKILNNNNFFC